MRWALARWRTLRQAGEILQVIGEAGGGLQGRSGKIIERLLRQKSCPRGDPANRLGTNAGITVLLRQVVEPAVDGRG